MTWRFKWCDKSGDIGSHQKLEEARNRFSLRLLGRNQPANTP
jgi:hypothetical protein